jgi:hypothetical protein
MTSTDPAATRIDPARLPQVITAFLTAQRARDRDAALPLLTGDAEVTDEGHTHRGHTAIGDWLTTAATEFTYTVALTGAARLDADRWEALHHLEGDFPGGVADLWFRFRLRDGLIAALVIEP